MIAEPRGLRAVQKQGRGRVHLTASPEGAAAHTLCGRTIEPGAARSTPAPGDCQLCLRRAQDPTFVAGMLFQEGRGQEVLAEALRRAHERPPRAGPAVRPVAPHPEPEPRPEPEAPIPLPAETPAAEARAAEAAAVEAAIEEPEAAGELQARGFKLFADRVYVSPGGTIVRLEAGTSGRISHLSHDGASSVRRTRDGGLLLQLGDVRVEVRGDVRLHVRAARR